MRFRRLIPLPFLLGGCFGHRTPSAPDFARQGLNPVEIREIFEPEADFSIPWADPKWGFEPSGLAFFEKEFFVVSDKPRFPGIYRLEKRKDGNFQATPVFGFPITREEGAFDFEGIARCGEDFWIVEERHSRVYRVSDEGKVDWVRPPFSWKDPYRGLEGVACSPDGSFWLAKERSFRRVYRWNPVKNEIGDSFDFPSSTRTVGGLVSSPDFSDLFFSGGFLYVMDRNFRQILKVRPEDHSLVDRVSLNVGESRHYDYHEPYGMAEGLVLNEAFIWVVLDNNQSSRRGDPGNRRPLLMRFKRPKGF